jgi:hypothetical protein
MVWDRYCHSQASQQGSMFYQGGIKREGRGSSTFNCTETRNRYLYGVQHKKLLFKIKKF